MRAAIYNPYWDTLGGGERYTASFVKVLIQRGWQVDIQWGDEEIISQIKDRFGIDISDKTNVVSSVKQGDGYDLCFWVSDGSIPLMRSRLNIIHFQVPFKDVAGASLINRMKFIRIKHVVCNSEFTKRVIDQEYSVNSKVVYPPVATADFKPKRKQNIILAVGRFSQLLQSKRQDVLVDVFKKMCDQGLKGWRLVLAGGVEVGAVEFVKQIRQASIGYPIDIIESPKFKELKILYGQAKIYWSASGYGVDEQSEPRKVEHFGITVVEAMAAGCVPVVANKGGHREIVDNGENGYLWGSKSELASVTKKIVEEPRESLSVSRFAIQKSTTYSYSVFRKEIVSLIQ